MKISDIAQKQLKKLDKPIQKRILDYLEERLEGCKDPRHFGEALKGNHANSWRYRVGDYRVICDLIDHELIVLALAIGHRREVYRN